MKLSEKYLNKISGSHTEGSSVRFDEEQTKLYGTICALEAQQTLLVSNPSTFPQERYMDKLAEIINTLEEIKVREQL
jgi:hypothetical protein